MVIYTPYSLTQFWFWSHDSVVFSLVNIDIWLFAIANNYVNSFKGFLFLNFHLCICKCVYECILCACQCPCRPQVGVGSPRTGVTVNRCDPTDICDRNWEPDQLPSTFIFRKLLLCDLVLISEIEIVNLSPVR